VQTKPSDAPLKEGSETDPYYPRCCNAAIRLEVPSRAQQATLGKRVLGLKVTDEAGQRINFGRASGRHWGKILSGIICNIGYIMAAFTERKQALHDLIAKTLVVRGRAA